MSEQITGAQALVQALEQAGAEVVFGIPGGAILPAYDPLFDSKLRHILVRHEQGAGHAAEGYAAATGKVGVCMATSGPGATNLVTPIADAYMDSVPMVADHRPGAQRLDRDRRVPGGGHPGHHVARSPSTTSWSPTPPRSRGGSPRRSTSPRPADPARCSSTSPRTRCRRRTTFVWPADARPARLPAGAPARTASRCARRRG